MAWVVAAVGAVAVCATVVWLAWRVEPELGRVMALTLVAVAGLWLLAETWPRR